jgi:glycosyltransferase involved in cell wall biosynthesis
MYKNRKVSLVIPCYNEERGLDKLLSKIPPHVDEVVVIDNNSTDRTAEVARKCGARVIREARRGYGQSYLSGFSEVKSDIIITMDGDNTYLISSIDKMLETMDRENYDFMFGCRYPLIDTNSQTFTYRAANMFISFIIRALFRINLIDSQSGMMAFNREAIENMKLKNTGMGFSQELKIKAYLKNRRRCGEIHINYARRLGEKKFSTIIDSFKNMTSLFSLWIQLVILRY